MATLSWLAALALLAAVPEGPSEPSPAKESLPPTQRPEDRPAHESPYSAFGAPHAKRPQAKKRGRPPALRRRHHPDAAAASQERLRRSRRPGHSAEAAIQLLTCKIERAYPELHYTQPFVPTIRRLARDATWQGLRMLSRISCAGWVA